MKTTLSSKEVFDSWYPQIYEIVHVKTGMTYIGCVYSHGKWYIERFKEHLKGSSQGFSLLYELKYAEVGDEFICKLITLVKEGSANSIEQWYISQIPINLSINHIVGCHQDTRIKRVESFIKLSQYGYCIKSFLSLDEPTLLQLNIDHMVSTNSDLIKLNKSYETITRTIISAGWKAGRKKLAERKGSGNLTSAELEAYSKLPHSIKNDWDKRDAIYVKERTSPGLSVMNSTLTCHCGKTVSRGNYARYHGAKCKLNQFVS